MPLRAAAGVMAGSTHTLQKCIWMRWRDITDFRWILPFEKLPEKIINIIFYGSGDEKITWSVATIMGHSADYQSDLRGGNMQHLERRYQETQSQAGRERILSSI